VNNTGGGFSLIVTSYVVSGSEPCVGLKERDRRMRDRFADLKMREQEREEEAK
jgi:hypothetical protein